MSQKVAEANKARIEAIGKLDEIQSHDVNTQVHYNTQGFLNLSPVLF
jgi:hypothetical protein